MKLRCGNPGRKPTPHLVRRPHHRVSHLVPQGGFLVALLGDQRDAPYALAIYENLDGAELLANPSLQRR